MRTSAILLALALASGCAAEPDLRARLDRAHVTLSAPQAAHDDRVGTYVSSPWGFSTSSYWIEGQDGLVLVDTQFLPSAAVECVELAQALTGKPVLLAIALHANPDKYNGTLELRRRGIRVIASEQVRALIPAVHEQRTRAFAPRYAPDWPAQVPLPDAFGATTTDLAVAGLHLRLHVLGPGCSAAHVVLEWEGHLFTGDLVANGTHAWLELGLAHEWLARLSELEALAPKRVHPGRGPSAGPELLARQRAYLERVVALVDAAIDASPELALEPTRAQVDALRARIEAEYPGLTLPIFVHNGLAAEWARQARARQR